MTDANDLINDANGSTQTQKTRAKSSKGGNIITTSAATSEIIATDAKTDAAAAAEIYNRSFAAGYVAERQRGAKELQQLIVKAGEATRAAIQSIDVENIVSQVCADGEAEAKKSLAGIFDQYF